MVISVVQIVASCITLYRSRGSQIERYGFAAFGLTVFPYALMSLVNAICLGFVGDYASIYVLRTKIFHEAVERQKKHDDNRGDIRNNSEESTPLTLQEFLSGSPGQGLLVIAQTRVQEDGGEVLSLEEGDQKEEFNLELTDGTSDKDPDSYIFGVHPFLNEDPQSGWNIDPMNDGVLRGIEFGIRWSEVLRTPYWASFGIFASFLGLGVPYLFIFALTGFRDQASTAAQRRWIISWLVANQVVGVAVFFTSCFSSNFSFTPHLPVSLSKNVWRLRLSTVLFFLICLCIPLIPAFGAFVTVAKMFLEFGSCTFF